jgi:hypothetical protein
LTLAVAVVTSALAVVTAVSSFRALSDDDGSEDGRPTTVELPAAEFETLDIAGDGGPEFVRIDGEILQVPEARTWVDRWGTPLGTGLIAGLFAVTAAVLSRGRSDGTEQIERLDRIEQLLREGQAPGPLPR